MSEQISFDEYFDQARASQAAVEGMARAEGAERVQFWKEAANLWIDGWLPGDEFTADDLVRVLGLPDQGVAKNNAVGAIFSTASKQGRIEWTGRFSKSERVIGHGNLQRVWRRT